MKLLAIDPGNRESALVVYDTETRGVLYFAKDDNDVLRAEIRSWRQPPKLLAIEMPVPRGMPASAQLFETCVQIGRYLEAWPWRWEYVDRAAVKLHLCHSSRAKDSNVRAALIDRYGGKEKAIGKKVTPGPLYGVSKDVWAALGVAVTVAER